MLIMIKLHSKVAEEAKRRKKLATITRRGISGTFPASRAQPSMYF